MIISRSINQIWKFSKKATLLYMFSSNNQNKHSIFPPKATDSPSITSQKTHTFANYSPEIITKMLQTMITKSHDNYEEEEIFIQKHIKELTAQHLILLLAYLFTKYGRMIPEKIFISSTKKLREIKDISPKQARKLIGAMMRLKWEHDPILRFYRMFEDKLTEFETEDLCYMVLYSQHSKKLNLLTIQKYIHELISRTNHNRKTNFLLYQCLHSTQSKKNFNSLISYKEAVRDFENTLKNSEYGQIHGKWELLDNLMKNQKNKQLLEIKLSEYPQLTLKQAVILGGIKNENLKKSVEEILERYCLELAPRYFGQLLQIVSKEEYLKRYLSRYGKQLSDLQKLQILQKAEEGGMSKQCVKVGFIDLFGQKCQINEQYLQKMQKLGQRIGVGNIHRHVQVKQQQKKD